jgi:hypothetical protein
MHEKLLNLIELAETDVQRSQQLIRSYASKEMQDAETLRLTALQNHVNVLKDILFDYEMEMSQKWRDEAVEVAKKYE